MWSMAEQHFWRLAWTHQWEHTINLFSVRAVRLKCRMSWWRGSGLVSLSSSSSPSSCSIAFWDSQVRLKRTMVSNKCTRGTRGCDTWHSQTSRRSSGLRRRSPPCRASSACIPPGTYSRPGACPDKQEANSQLCVLRQRSPCKFWPLSYLGMLYNGVILKHATTALRLCLDNSLCQTIFFDLKGCSV